MNLAKLVPLAFSAATLSVGLNASAIAAGQAPPLPFTATLTITEQITVIGAAPCPVTAAVSGSGTATQMGRSTVTSNDCIIPQGDTLLFMSPIVVLTAANGDRIHATYVGAVTQSTGAIVGSYAISGGTGRFANASGSGQLVGAEDTSQLRPPPAVSTLPGRITLTGTISY